jgi:hypothetical protein
VKLRLPVLLAAAALAALAAAPAAQTKGDVRATLTTRVPAQARPGTTLVVGWLLRWPGPNGALHPFGAGGVFVRLRGGSGGSTTALGRALARGRYEARVRVPAGGIRRIQIGLHSWNDYGPADWILPLTNDPFAQRP